MISIRSFINYHDLPSFLFWLAHIYISCCIVVLHSTNLTLKFDIVKQISTIFSLSLMSISKMEGYLVYLSMCANEL